MASNLNKSAHGGKREGARRPPFFDKPMKRRNVMLDEKTVAVLIKLGNGNLSEGIRKAAEPYKQ